MTNLDENSNFLQLIKLYPILKEEQKDRIKIFISGKEFRVQNRQLKIYPETLLGNEDQRNIFYNQTLNAYQFNRHPAVFESILYYYLSPGILLRPVHIEPEIFYEELRFWNISASLTETFIEDDMIPLDNIRFLPSSKWRCLIWKSLTYPDSLRFPFGELIIGISIFFTLLSCLSFMNEILPTVSELIKLQSISNTNRIFFPLYSQTFYLIEIISIIAFTIELNLRIISTPKMSLLFYDVFNFLDFMIIISGSICLITSHLHNSHQLNNLLSFYSWLLIFKSFRIYRLGRHMSNLRLLYRTIALSLNEICSLIIFVIFCMLFFGILMYVIDNSEAESNTRNILDGFWLAFITLTTLGYGDIYPRSLGARLSAGLCALTGIILFSLSTTIVFLKYTTLIQNKWKHNRNIHYIVND